MADEIRLLNSLQIRKGNKFYQSSANSFVADFDGSVGPTPGDTTVPSEGVDVDLSALTELGGMIRFYNTDDAITAFVGIRDITTDKFYPFMDLLAGEFYTFRLSQFLGGEFGTGSGTGTIGDDSVLHIRADTGSIQVTIEAFDR